MPAKFTITVKKGDTLRHELAGPGGWGDPFDRDPEAVLADLRDELIGDATAREAYGVVIDRERWRVVGDETGALRQRLREARGGRAAPAVIQDRPGTRGASGSEG